MTATVPSLFMVEPGASDGNMATLEGNLTNRPTNGSGLDLASPVKLNPWSMPLDIIFADLDGDGHQEQVVAAGEAQSRHLRWWLARHWSRRRGRWNE